MSITENLNDVRFYTPLDPYHHSVDNRPLQDLDQNIKTVAAGVDGQIGSSKRAALAATVNAYVKLGGRGVMGTHVVYPNSLLLDFTFGYGVFLLTETISNIATSVPLLAVHDQTTRFTNIAPAANAGNAVKYLVQAYYRDATNTDRIGAEGSIIKVLTLSLKNSNEYPMSGVEPTISPDVGRVPVMEIVVPYGVSTLQNATIKYREYKTIAQASNIPATTRIDYVHKVATLTMGQSNVSLANSDIDVSNMSAVEVFVDGVNQFNWTWNSSTGNIVLGEPVSATAEVRVRQAVLYQI